MTHTRSVALAVALPAPLSLVLPISALPFYLESLPRSVHVYRLLAAAVCMVADPCMLAAVRMFAAVECTCGRGTAVRHAGSAWMMLVLERLMMLLMMVLNSLMVLTSFDGAHACRAL